MVKYKKQVSRKVTSVGLEMLNIESAVVKQ